MEERRIKVLAAIMLIAGLVVLSYLVWTGKTEDFSDPGGPSEDDRSESKNMEIGRKTSTVLQEDGSRATVNGKVVQVIDRGKVSFLKLSPASRYQLVSFDSLDVEEGSQVKVSGRVKTYKGKKEIIIDKISVLE